MAESDAGSNSPESTAGGAQASPSTETHPSNDILVAHDGVSAALPVSQNGGVPVQAGASTEAASDGVEKLQFAHVFDSETSGNLDQYLSFTWDGAQTTVGVSGPAGGVEQKIVFEGINLTSIGDGSASAIISALLAESNKPT